MQALPLPAIQALVFSGLLPCFSQAWESFANVYIISVIPRVFFAAAAIADQYITTLGKKSPQLMEQSQEGGQATIWPGLSQFMHRSMSFAAAEEGWV